jgi:hypothetical protein
MIALFVLSCFFFQSPTPSQEPLYTLDYSLPWQDNLRNQYITIVNQYGDYVIHSNESALYELVRIMQGFQMLLNDHKNEIQIEAKKQNWSCEHLQKIFEDIADLMFEITDFSHDPSATNFKRFRNNALFILEELEK